MDKICILFLMSGQESILPNLIIKIPNTIATGKMPFKITKLFSPKISGQVKLLSKSSGNTK